MHREQTLSALAVMRVFEGTRLQDALALVDEADGSRGRTLVHELAYGTLRHWGTLDAIVDRLARKPIGDPLLRTLVAVALYQLEHTRAPAFAIVDRAVHAAGAAVRPEAKGLVNALLRRFLRERDDLLRAVLSSDVARFSYPGWWIERVRRDHPDRWQEILDAGNAHAPLMLRVNRRASSRVALARRFAEAGIDSREVFDCALMLATPRPVAGLPGFAEGWFSVQDLAAQHAAPLLDVRDGMRVLDACAAPGGKTTHLLEIADVDLLAIDNDPTRIARIEENVARLRLGERRLRLVAGDAGDPASWWDERPFDRILLDAPCTASGVVRRHPDAKWRHRESDVERFARGQDRLLDALWPLLARGGKILYATCSVFAAENRERAAAFSARHGDALRETVNLPAGSGGRAGQLLPSLEGASHNQDGFFYALFGKR